MSQFRKTKRKINLEDLPLIVNKVEFAERWQEVLEVVNSGEMPPESELQPSSDEKMDLVANLSVTLMDARKLLADTDGKVTMRRLNRREYQNTIKELLGVTVEDSDLQSDRQENSFDTFGSSLYLSSDQISNYYVIGDKILKRAFDYAEMDLSLRKIRIDPEQGVNSLSDYGLKQLRDCQSRLKNWYNAVDTAIQKLPNSESIFELKEKSRLVKFYNNWNDYLGAPSPVEFGFKDTRHAEISALNGPLTYEHLLEQAYLPDRNNGAYIMPAPSPHLRVGFRIPEKWPEGDYTVNISAAALDLDDLKIDSNSSQDIRETPSKDRKFIDLVYGPENITLAGSYKVTGTIQSPSIISIPYKHRKVNVRGVVIRERGHQMKEI